MDTIHIFCVEYNTVLRLSAIIEMMLEIYVLTDFRNDNSLLLWCETVPNYAQFGFFTKPCVCNQYKQNVTRDGATTYLYNCNKQLHMF